METTQKPSRRGLFLGVAALAAIAAGSRWVLGRDTLTFSAIENLDGWRMAETDGITSLGGSASGAVLLGIDNERVPTLRPEALCSVLYQNTAPGTPVAIFTDFFCPNCRALEPRLTTRDDLSITWHELPLLGPSSEMVARATMAAERQGNFTYRTQLRATPFRPTIESFVHTAILLDLDGERLVRDMYSRTIDDRLQISRAAAETLGVWGTPAFTIGKTLAMGALSDAQIDQLIEEDGATAC